MHSLNEIIRSVVEQCFNFGYREMCVFKIIQKHFPYKIYESFETYKSKIKKKNRIYEWNVQHFTFNNFPVRIFLKAIFTKIFIIPFHLMGLKFTGSFYATGFGYHKILRVHRKSLKIQHKPHTRKYEKPFA